MGRLLPRFVTQIQESGSPRRWNRVALGASVLLIGLCGCSGSSGPAQKPELGEVTDIVSRSGKPLPNIHVVFEKSPGVESSGTTDQEGRYELIYSDGTKGAAIGSNTVRITEVAASDPKSHIPSKYNEESTLKADVKGKKNEFDFNLKW